MKKIFLVSLIFLAGCSSTKTISINSETVLNENTTVDWAITHNDSIIYFNRVYGKYAEIIGNQLIYTNGKDSSKTYLITEFGTIHTYEHATLSVFIMGSIAVTLMLIGYLLSGMKIG